MVSASIFDEKVEGLLTIKTDFRYEKFLNRLKILPANNIQDGIYSLVITLCGN